MRAKNGFSIFEVIAVLLILLVLAVIAGSRLIEQEADLHVETDVIKSHLRYARFMALSNDNYDWKITFSENLYRLTKVSKFDGSESRAYLPDEGSHERGLTRGLTVGFEVVTFDEWGSPGPKNKAIVISSKSSSETVIITKNTGFIP